MDGGAIVVAVCGLVAAACALAAIIYAGVYLFLPENRKRREALQMARDLDRAAKRPHQHAWGKWQIDRRVNVYDSAYIGKTGVEDMPVRQDVWQKRTCADCGFSEWNKQRGG